MTLFRAYPAFLVGCIILVVVGISWPHMTSIPRVFYDEGITIEIARNFQLFRVLDVQTSPGVFSGIPYVTGSTGFPVTIPLAGVFEVFGFGLFQARIYALLWLIAFFVITYLFVKRFWGTSHALATLLFVGTFASLYDNGRRVMGDIPGFALMLGGLTLFFSQKRPFLAGLLIGLATVAKPSVFLPIAPALLLWVVIFRRSWLRPFLSLAIGMIPALAVWVWLAFPNPTSLETWRTLILFYQNQYGGASVPIQNVLHNLGLFLSQSTLIYFLFFTIILFATRRWLTRNDDQRQLERFFFIYGVLVFLFFLKSPGYFRYLLPIELIIFMLLPSAIQVIAQTIPSLKQIRYLPHFATIAIAVVQLLQLFFLSPVVYATSEPEMIARFFQTRATGMIGIINSPQIGSLLPSERKLQYMYQNDSVIIGRNPLDMAIPELPRYIVMPSGLEMYDQLTEKEKGQLRRYKKLQEGKWIVFELSRP